MMRYILRTLLASTTITLVMAGVSAASGAQAEHPPLGGYTVHMFDPYGNAEYAFDFKVLTISSKGTPGQYEAQMGRVPESERQRWLGEYTYDPEAKRLRWLSGPFQRSDLYRQEAKNPQGGKVLVKNGRWTVFLNNKARGTNTNR
jgi:hypothetical protein